MSEESVLTKAIVTVVKPDGTLGKKRKFFCISSAKSYYNRMKTMQAYGWSENLVVVG